VIDLNVNISNLLYNLRRMKYLALFDFDNVIYMGHSFFDSTKFAVQRRLVSQKTLDKVVKEFDKYKKGKQTYDEMGGKLLQAYAKDIKGKKEDNFIKAAHDFFSVKQSSIFPYFKSLVPVLRQTHDIYVVTTNGQFIAKPLVPILGIKGYYSSIFGVMNEVFTGKIFRSLTTGKGPVKEIADHYPKEKSIGVGDSDNDIDMLELVENKFCFEPTKELENIAKKKKWEIIDRSNAEKKILEINDN